MIRQKVAITKYLYIHKFIHNIQYYFQVVSEWHSSWHSSHHSSWHSSACEDNGDSVLGESWSVEHLTQLVESPTQTTSDPCMQQTVLLYSLEAITFEQV